MSQESKKRRYLLVFGHGRSEGLGCALRDAAIAQIEANEDLCRVHDLLSDGFDPVLRLESGEPFALPPKKEQDPLAYRYCQDVLWAEVLIFLHPVWWFSVPAILKGWIDRILVQGVAIHQAEGGSPQGLLANKSAILLQTFGTNKLVEQTVFRKMALQFWHKAVFMPTGMKNFRALALHNVEGLSPKGFDDFCVRMNQALS